MPIVKFLVQRFGSDLSIKPVEVDRETAQFVIVRRGSMGREARVAKVGSFERYFDTFDEAKAYLVDSAQDRIEMLEAGLRRARNDLAMASALQPEGE